MTTRRALVVALVAALLLAIATPAMAAPRYCGQGAKFSTTTQTHYVMSVIGKPGWQLMSTRKHWARSLSYYRCRP